MESLPQNYYHVKPQDNAPTSNFRKVPFYNSRGKLKAEKRFIQSDMSQIQFS